MRDLVFKNLTSADRKRKILTSSEVMDNDGVRCVIQRHFICLVKEMRDQETQQPAPYLSVLKERDNRRQTEKFFCRIKGSVLAKNKEKLYLILFVHSLKINFAALKKNSAAVKYSGG